MFNLNSDTDDYGIPDDEDDCPADYNTDQANFDDDDLGDVCDDDDDNDGVLDGVDYFLFDSNVDQSDQDGDEFGDACDTHSTALILIKPRGVLDAQPPVFEWSNVGSATWYRLWVTDDSGVLLRQWYKAADICGAVTCNFASEMNTMGIATWQVRVYDETLGDWSDRGMFWDDLSRPAAATLVLPSGTTSYPTPEVAWSVVFDTTWYKLQILNSSEELVKDQ